MQQLDKRRKVWKGVKPLREFKALKDAEVYGKTDEGRQAMFVARQVHSKGTREYEFWKYDDFLAYYENLPPHERFYHEMFRPFSRQRVAMDLDSKTGNYTMETWNCLIQTLIEIAMAVIHEKCEGAVPTFEAYHAHREGKFSTHLVFDVVLNSSFCVSNLVYEFIAPRIPPSLVLDHLRALIDVNIYATLTKTAQMRMPYSNAYQHLYQDACLYPMLRWEGDTFDREAFKRSLVAHFDPAVPRVSYTIVEVDPADRIQTNTSVFFESLTTQQKLKVGQQIKLVREWLHECHRVGQQDVTKAKYREVRWRVERAVCGTIGDYHRGNGAYVTVHFNVLGEADGIVFRCTDCNFEWPAEVPVSVIVDRQSGFDLYAAAMKEALEQTTNDAPLGMEESMTSDSG